MSLGVRSGGEYGVERLVDLPDGVREFASWFGSRRLLDRPPIGDGSEKAKRWDSAVAFAVEAWECSSRLVAPGVVVGGGEISFAMARSSFVNKLFHHALYLAYPRPNGISTRQ